MKEKTAMNIVTKCATRVRSDSLSSVWCVKNEHVEYVQLSVRVLNGFL